MKRRSETAAGGVVYRLGPGGPEVVLGAQRDRLSGAHHLRLPKGKLDAGETAEQAAVREVEEETGVRARIVADLGSSEYAYAEKKTRVAKRVLYFLMEHDSGEPHARDGEMTRAFWCPIDEAARTLSFANEREAVERARRRLAGGDA